MRESVLGKIVSVLVTLSDNFLGTIYDLLEKLAGKNGAEWLDALKKFLRKENPWGSMHHWKVWRTIRFGNGINSGGRLCALLDVYGIRVSTWAREFMQGVNFTVSSREAEVDLVLVSMAELGLEHGALLKDVYKKAQESGLSLCVKELAPQLRFQLPPQEPKKDEELNIAMVCFLNSEGDPVNFRLEHLALGTDYGYPDRFCGSKERFVFTLKKI